MSAEMSISKGEQLRVIFIVTALFLLLMLV